jgi:hypothetical protein
VHIPRVFSLGEAKILFCEQRNVHAVLTGDRIQNQLSESLFSCPDTISPFMLCNAMHIFLFWQTAGRTSEPP